MRAAKAPLTVVDLFAGAGGLSLGFIEAGFHPLLAIDSDPAACRTYRDNLGSHIVEQCVDPLIRLPRTAVIVGGPPCQGFSSAGLRRADDKRNSLVGVFAAIVARLKPPAFVFENVEGFLTADGGSRVRELLEPLIEAGYRIHLRKVNLANYGVPQHRKRVIAIGGLGWEPTFPNPTHWAHGAPGAHVVGQHLPQTPTLEDALQGLPHARGGRASSLDDHVYRPLTGIDLQRVKALSPGQTMRDLPERLWHRTYQKRAFRRVQDGTPSERRGGPPAGLRRLRSDQPSKAITSGARTEFVHPSEDRFLTLRECARIQTFPDSFAFHGSLSERAVLIGNAVPPIFARRVAEELAHNLGRHERTHRSGMLLSFQPTAANGLSPALERMQNMVLSTFPFKTEQRDLPLG